MTVEIVKKYAGVVAALLVAGLFFFLVRPGETNGTQLSMATFKVADGWGYRILNGDSLLIHQPFIPVVPGVKRFKTERDAALTGELTLSKIKHGLFPPSVTLKELDSLGIIR